MTNGEEDIILGTKNGMSICFAEKDVRPMGRTARGVKGIALDDGDEVIGLVVGKQGSALLVLTENGYGKRTLLTEYRTQTRAGKGTRAIAKASRNGSVVNIMSVDDGDELMVISMEGQMIRLAASGINIYHRVAQGVKVMNLPEGDKVVAVGKVLTKDDEEDVIEEGVLFE